MMNRHFGRQALGAIALAAALAAPAAAQTLSIDATPSPAVVGTPVLLNLNISDIADLYAWQFSLAFNPAVLQVTSVTEGAFLATGGGTLFGSGTVDNTAGTISFMYDTLIGQVPGATGSGTLVQISANVLQAGSSPLNFSNLIFLDSALADIGVTVNNGLVTAVPEPAAFWMLGAGLAGLAALRRRRAA